MKNTLPKQTLSKGFTLIELLVVITIIATLAVVVYVAINPAQRVRAANDARRTTDVDSILTAIHAFSIDNGGTLPGGLVATDTQIGTGDGAACGGLATGGCNVPAGTACINLGATLVKYLKTMPIDPLGTTFTSEKTGYAVSADANGIVTVKACGSQGTNPISSSR